jgi:hypothetical protein
VKAAAAGRTVRVAIVTNRGTNRRSKLGRLEAQVLDEDRGALVQRNLRPGEYYVRAIDAERETVAHIWAVPEEFTPPREGDDGPTLDRFLEEVKRANPAEWITVKALRRIWRSLSRFERWMFLRQNANQWVTAGFAALDRGQFWALHKPGLEIPKGKASKVYVGLDRASKWDSTAIVPVWKAPDGNLRCAGVIILESPRDGSRRRTRDVGRILETMRERWPNMVLVFDRNAGGGDIAEELEEKHGLRVIDHSQGVPFDLASMRLAEVVEEAATQAAAEEIPKLLWDAPEEHRELFAGQVLAAVMKETAGGRRWRGEAPDEDTQIDGFDGLAMAVHMASQPVEDELAIDVDDYRIERL